MIGAWPAFLLSSLALASGTGAATLPLERAARPLVLPEGTYRIDLAGRYGPVDDGEGLFRLEFGGRMGLGLDLQLRLDLIRWNFSRVSGYGLEQPRLALAHAFLRGPVEIAAEAGVEIPSGGDFAGDATLAVRAHFGRWLRFDLAAGVAGSSSRIRPESEAFGRAALVATVWRPLSLAAVGETRLLTLTGAETWSGRAGGELALAFPKPSGKDEGEVGWELVAQVGSPEVRLEGRELEAPRFGHAWEGGVGLRLFFDQPASSVGRWDDGFSSWSPPRKRDR